MIAEPNRRPNRSLLWVVLAVALFLVLGCAVTFAAGAYYFVGQARTVAPTPRPVAQTVATRPPAVVASAPAVVVATPEGGTDYETAVLANIYAQVNPSVVNVTVLGRGQGIIPEEVRPPNLDPDELIPYSSGSGFVWDTTGHIVTNNHVVEGADEVQVTFSDGAVAVAEVVGIDPDSDLAVLRIDPEGYQLTPVRLGQMENVHVGMRVAAIGNPFGLEGTLTSGIVSAIGRSIPARQNFSIPDSIQTDTAINPGNSGGPLLNEQGEVIGVNAQIRSEVRSNSGVGFAIPVNVVARVVPALIETGVFAHSFMGVSGGTFSPVCAAELGLPKELRGALVLEVLENTPAEQAGLRGGEEEINSRYPGICPEVTGGDVIIAVDGEPVTRFDDVLAYLQRNTSPGDTITLTIWRDSEAYDLDLTLGARPGSVQ
jgi:2-alkenal reductase